jgi:hypothetical protein
MSRHVVPESGTTVYYPRDKRKVKLNHKGEIIEDTGKGDEKNRREPWMDG